MNQRGWFCASLMSAVVVWTACSDPAPPAVSVESIALSVDSIAIQFRDSTSELTATPKGALGVDLEAEVAWQSKNTNVVMVVPNGKVARLIPVRPGTAEVEASSENVIATAKVVVLDTVFSVQIAAADTLVTMGRTLVFDATVQGPATASRRVTWRIADDIVGSIDSVTEGTNRVYVSSRETGRTEVIATSAVDRIKTARIPFRTARPVSLAFESQPGQTTALIRANDVLIPGPIVIARDLLGSVFPGPLPVTLAVMPGTGAAGATLFGTPVITTLSGQAQFTNVGIDSSGTDYRLTATSPGLAPANSSPFTVGPECPGTSYSFGTLVTGTLTTASCQSGIDQYYNRYNITSVEPRFMTIKVPQPFRLSIVFPNGTRVGAADSSTVIVPPGSYSIRVQSGPTANTGAYQMSTGTPNPPVGITGQIVCLLYQVVPGIDVVDQLRCGSSNGTGGTFYRLHLKANAGATVSVSSTGFEPDLHVWLAVVNGTLVSEDPAVVGRFSAQVVVPADPVARNVVVGIATRVATPLGTPFTVKILPR